MKNKLLTNFLFLGVIAFVFTSCDPVHTVDYQIYNDSDFDLWVKADSTVEDSIEMPIGSMHLVRMIHQKGRAQNSLWEYNFPIVEHISASEGKVLAKDPNDPSNWTSSLEKESFVKSKVIAELHITNDDLE